MTNIPERALENPLSATLAYAATASAVRGAAGATSAGTDRGVYARVRETGRHRGEPVTGCPALPDAALALFRPGEGASRSHAHGRRTEFRGVGRMAAGHAASADPPLRLHPSHDRRIGLLGFASSIRTAGEP